MRRTLLFLAIVSMAALPTLVEARQRGAVRSPASGVLCDRFICADANGVSPDLTARYLGKSAVAKLATQGSFDMTEFTFASGLFCSTKERLCRQNRYFGADGKRSGSVSSKYTKILFGPRRGQQR